MDNFYATLLSIYHLCYMPNLMEVCEQLLKLQSKTEDVSSRIYAQTVLITAGGTAEGNKSSVRAQFYTVNIFAFFFTLQHFLSNSFSFILLHSISSSRFDFSGSQRSYNYS